MGKKTLVLLTTLLCLSTGLASAAKTNTLSTNQKLRLDNELKAMIGDTGTKVPGLGVVVYKNGKEVYKNFLGSRIINNQDRSKDLPVTENTRFRAASVSKHFTAYTIMQLAEKGKIGLDEDISNYLGFKLRNPNFPDTPITVRMLMSHTSSLRDGALYTIAPQYSVKEFFSPTGKYFENGAHYAPKDQTPGAYFKYANLNYGLLGTIIEAVTGKRFDKYQKSHILKQLDIKADYCVGNLDPAEFKNLGTIYQKNTKGKWDEKGPWVAQIDGFNGKQPAKDLVYIENPDHRETDTWQSLKGYKPGTNATFFSPQGGLRISYGELGHDLEFLINGGIYKGKRILKASSLAEMIKPQWIYNPQKPNGSTYGGTIEAYGLGLYHIIGNSTSRVCKNHVLNLVGHTGEAYGELSGVFFDPKTKNGFIYMMNGEAVAEDDDPRSAGRFSGNYIWEENIMNAISENAFFES